MRKNRREAKQFGDAFYDTLKPCINNHLSPRYTNNGNCVLCAKQKFHNAIAFVKFEVHPEDVATITAYVEMVRIQRAYELTKGPSRAQLLDMWTRAHGETVARQMMELEDAREANQTPTESPAP
jgi:hypothetical protein